MAIALLTSTSGGTGINPVTSAAINTTGASLLIVTLSNFYFDPATATIADSKGNTWFHGISRGVGGSEGHSVIWYAWNPIVGAGHTVTITLTSNISFTFSCYSGARTSTNPLDQQNGSQSAVGLSSMQAGSITPSGPGALILCALGSGGSLSSGFAIDSGFSLVASLPYLGAVHEGIALGYLVQAVAGPVNPTWTWTAGNSAACVIASFLAAPVIVIGRGSLMLMGVQ